METKSESLEGNYKFVADPSELAWFFENVLKDLSKENIRKSYLMCIATRPKKLSKEERETFGISGYPRFNSPFELADSVVKAGFNVILKATNHINDKNEEARLIDLNTLSV